MIEILSNYFRSVIVLSPKDLLPSVYLCLNKVAPDYAGLELGIAETTLIKVCICKVFIIFENMQYVILNSLVC